MTSTSFNVQNEGSSTFRPPFFDDNDYVYWKARINIYIYIYIYIYIQFIDYDLLLSIENGPHKPTKIKNDITVPKARSDYTDGKKNVIYRC